MIGVDKLGQAIFDVLGYDEFNLIRANKVYDRILFDYGYYGDGVTIKRVKDCLFYYNHIVGLGNNKFQEGKDYKYRLTNEEIKKIITLLRTFNN